MKVFIIILSFCLLSCSSTSIIQEKTTVREDNTGRHIRTEKTINGYLVENLEEIWENQYVKASGQVPVVNKYDDESRNIALARRGAILDAQRNLAEKVNSITITEEVTLSDYVTTDNAKSTLRAVLQNVEVISEFYNEDTRIYEVQVQMPQAPLIIILKQYLE